MQRSIWIGRSHAEKNAAQIGNLVDQQQIQF